jgi:hypothetical protein
MDYLKFQTSEKSDDKPFKQRFSVMISKKITCHMTFCFLLVLSIFCFALLPVQAQGLAQKTQKIGWSVSDHSRALIWSSDLKSDTTAEVAVEFSSAYPGSEDFLVSVLLKNPDDFIAGFDFEIDLDPDQLADFSTVQIYVDSIDTCPEPEDSCWYYFPVRECLLQSYLEGSWYVLEAHGEVGDTTKPDCDRVWVLGIDLVGAYPIPPNPNYRSLFKFGVDLSCVPDSLTNRAVSFSMTGHLSDPYGALVPVIIHPGELLIWWSIPGDANNDSLVNGADIVFLINYLFQEGPEPCVMEAADPNGDCQVGPADVVYLLNYLFRGGSPPQPGCAH